MNETNAPDDRDRLETLFKRNARPPLALEGAAILRARRTLFPDAPVEDISSRGVWFTTRFDVLYRHPRPRFDPTAIRAALDLLAAAETGSQP